jgi:hypothetical protein
MKRRAFVQGMTAAASAAAIGRPGWTQRLPLDGGRQVTRLDAGWRFLRDDPDGAQNPAFDDSPKSGSTARASAATSAVTSRSSSISAPASSPDVSTCWPSAWTTGITP